MGAGFFPSAFFLKKKLLNYLDYFIIKPVNCID